MALVLSPTTAAPAASALAVTGQPVLAPMSSSYVINLTFDGLHRDYRIHVPPQAASGLPQASRQASHPKLASTHPTGRAL